MKRLLWVFGIASVVLATSSVYAAGNNPFKPKPKPAPPPMVTPEQGGLTQAEVIALLEQRMALFSEKAKGLMTEEETITQTEVLDSLLFLGLINKEFVYKDNEKGCYIYENAKSGEVVESRCYSAVVKRLRDLAREDASDEQSPGGAPSNR